MTDKPTHRAAVLGQPIGHSRSPVLHNAGYAALGLDDWAYDRFDCDADALPGLVGGADLSYRGFSVTMPAKFAALAFADEATERARRIGSANTLVRTATGWRADNTDVDGIRGALVELLGGGELVDKRAVVVGGGGTARPAIWALLEAGVSHITVINRSDRTGELSELVDAFPATLSYLPLEGGVEAETTAAAVVISTVPSAAIEGLEGKLAHAPVLDVIYDPWPTPLVTVARSRNIPAVGGHVMLAHQAYGQFEQFTGHPAPRDAMRAALEASLGM
ncbi:shikimate-5-dehydrogenase [Corynebacterium efficiens YS-314]|uniref:shikimate dehydrogenase (NADP(+)) n=1 Tax=Corynebacterium efficiens (strain DSM 44549 / YS-314 / AJ 12310 / JCM 11189 / NBRC 100395) TaxID=196164 RepID=Q8FT26_COREF|nr:shikimate dehydrogenase [Corynebacterium efficiens]EEW49624.1 shikimate-5-dehydrogenase [Corynebacterium efficiens YS-314]BAC18555.1 putative shikimate 5-dehydrogenase [Corynebacterium efficiens YS-314]